ncbi:MAG: hypothetical protein AB1921_12145, partial [Thermodesulfobacteriota bacterium]
GRPFDVDKDHDGINDSHSFILTGIPQGVNVRLFMIEAGQIYHVGFSFGGGAANVFSMNGSDSLDLGFLEIVPIGAATPQNNPLNNPNVTCAGLDGTLPSILNNPDTEGMTLQELLDEGFAALRENWILRARGFFAAAVAAAGDTPSNDRDVANLFYAGTRIVGLWYEIQPGTDPAAIQTLGDLLDRFGFTFVYGLRTNFRNLKPLNLQNDIPADCPTGADIQDFFVNVVRPEVVGAIGNINAVSQGVAKNWYVPLLDKLVKTDYADALLMKAGLKAALAAIDIQYYYNLDADIYKMIHGTQTMQDLLAGNFLKPRVPSATLVGAKLLLIQALKDAVAALGIMRNRPGAPEDYFEGLFGFSQKCAPFLQIAAFSAQTALEGTMEFELFGEVKFALDLPAFFRGVDGNALAPPFVKNAIVGLFPDITLGGVFPLGFIVAFPNGLFGLIPADVDVNINFDRDENSIPDILKLNFASEILDRIDTTNPPAALTEIVKFGYELLYKIFGDTLSDADVDALANAAPDFIPAAVVTAVAEFSLSIAEQFSDPMAWPF